MARYIRLLILTALVVFPACRDTDPVIHNGGTDGPISSYLDVELIRFGTDFRSVAITEAGNVPLLVGRQGIAMVRISQSGGFAPVSLGVANHLNDVDYDYFKGTARVGIGGDGLNPGDPGIFLYRHSDDDSWIIKDHPATGNITDLYNSEFVTSAGEFVANDDGTPYIAFTEPGGSGFTALDGGGQAVLVGAGGMIYRNSVPNDLTNWLDESILNGPDFNAVRAIDTIESTSGIQAYAVGGTEVWYHDDGAWQRVYYNAGGTLYGLTPTIGSGRIWFAGSNGVILTVENDQWDETSVGAGLTLRDIAFRDNVVYTCGDDGALFRKDGNDWIDLGFSNTSPWNAIDGLSSSEVYAANGDTLMTWDGDKWGPLATNFNEITSLHAVSSDRIWVTSRSADGFDNFVQVWTGNTFNMSHHSSMDPFNSVWCDGLGDTIMVAANNGYVFRNGGVGWEWLTADPARKHFYDLDGTSAHDVFAVGQDGMIAHFNGASWKLMDSGVTHTLRAISGTIAVGDNGAITRWDGSQWKAESAGTTAHLNAVCVIGGKEAWAVGDGGVIISNDGGSKWTLYERSLYTVELRSVWGATTTDIWFGGDEGYLLRLIP